MKTIVIIIDDCGNRFYLALTNEQLELYSKLYTNDIMSVDYDDIDNTMSDAEVRFYNWLCANNIYPTECELIILGNEEFMEI